MSLRAVSCACVGRRLAVLPLLAAALWLGACGGAEETADEAGATAASGAGQVAGEDATAASTPAPGAPATAEDSIRMHEDSLYELRLLRTREASMESYASCMVKAKHSDPQTRPVLEAVCQRSHGAPAAAPRR